MGAIPSTPFSPMKLWFAVTVVTLAALAASGEVPQAPAAQPDNSAHQQVSVTERKTLGLKEFPTQQKADILMAREMDGIALPAWVKSNRAFVSKEPLHDRCDSIAFLTKPYTGRALFDAVREALAKRPQT